MKERATSTQATRERILEAVVALSVDRWYDEITLREIATEAGVALQTVVNHFGSKEDVVAAAIEAGTGRETFMGSRDEAPAGEIEQAVALLVDDYERVGDSVMRLLALETRVSAVAPILEGGRSAHRDWVKATFPEAFEDLRGRGVTRRLDLLVCATDVYTWKLLRRDRKLSRAQAAAAMAELVRGLHPR